MKVLVTGASGFLGRQVVQAAVNAGHHVVALVRPTAELSNLGWSAGVSVVRGDLRQTDNWTQELADVEAVAHLAAATSGDLPTQFSGTVVATENLLAHLPMQSLQRFVHVSSFSVYDYASMGSRGTLTEVTPIEPAPEKRDAYTITKIAQERLVTDACEESGTRLVIIRPGAIVGPGKDWGFGRVMKLGRFDVIFSPGARFPITYVANCAQAIVKALDAQVPSGAVYNIVDDDPPSYYSYHLMGRRMGRAGPAIYLPWALVRLIGATVALLNQLVFNGRAKIPEWLDARRQCVRWRPMLYPNCAAKRDLGWSPVISVQAELDKIVEAN